MVDEEILAGFDAAKQVSSDKRGHNRRASRQMLDKLGVKYTTNNNGVHLVVAHGQIQVDFWPGTGKWIARDQKKTEGRGVHGLLKHIGVRRDQPKTA